MYISLSETPMPTISTPDLAAALLARVIGLEAPAFIVADAGESFDTAIEGVRPVLEAAGARLGYPTSIISIGPKGEINDLGLHLDFIPEPDPDEDSLVVHYTGIGTATLRATTIGPDFMRLSAAIPDVGYRSANVAMPMGTREHFVRGLIDPRVLDPTVYVGRIVAGSLAIFRCNGPKPTVHEFVTLPGVPVRTFQALNADIPRTRSR